ncbi:hypothetical protein [Kitasatospora sp. NPDC004531]
MAGQTRTSGWPTTALVVGLVGLGMAGVISVASCDPVGAGPVDAAPSAGSDNRLADLTAEQVLEQARQAGAGLTSVRGTVRTKRDATAVEYSLAVARNGDCTGTVSEDGAETEVRRLAGTAWVKPSPALLAQVLPDAGPELADKWLSDPGELGRHYTAYCDLLLRTAALQGPIDFADAEWTKSGVRQLKGAPADFLAFRIGGTVAHGRSGTVAVAAEGRPYLLSVDEAGDAATAMRFYAFDEPVAVAAPPAEQTADASGRHFVLDGGR